VEVEVRVMDGMMSRFPSTVIKYMHREHPRENALHFWIL
jgi:hypothetical protein